MDSSTALKQVQADKTQCCWFCSHDLPNVGHVAFRLCVFLDGQCTPTGYPLGGLRTLGGGFTETNIRSPIGRNFAR